jgi:hypothetical protein
MAIPLDLVAPTPPTSPRPDSVLTFLPLSGWTFLESLPQSDWFDCDTPFQGAL